MAFELLRFADAGFEFHSGAEPSEAGEPHQVDDVLAEAETRLAEWREIEAVVPSLDVWVQMVAEIGADQTVTPTQWRVLAQVGTGATGHAVADRLGEGEYDVCRQLRDLVEDGMVELDEAPADAAEAMPAPVLGVDVAAAWDAPVDEPTFVEPDLEPEDVSALGADLASFVADGTVPEPVPVDAGDLVSELSQLSPRAAAAVEATWGDQAPATEIDEEPAPAEPPTPEVDAARAGDDIDQNLLLRFLSSAKG